MIKGKQPHSVSILSNIILSKSISDFDDKKQPTAFSKYISMYDFHNKKKPAFSKRIISSKSMYDFDDKKQTTAFSMYRVIHSYIYVTII